MKLKKLILLVAAVRAAPLDNLSYPTSGDLELRKLQNSQQPLVDMEEWAKDSRVLDCFECFQAKGRFCHKKDYGDKMFDTLGLKDFMSLEKRALIELGDKET